MNTSAEVTVRFADSGPDGYVFALKGKQIEELQRQCGNVPLGVLGNRILSGGWDYRDIYHTIRLGLIGGGMAPTRAQELTDTYILPLAEEDNPSSPVAVATLVISAVFFGMNEITETGDVGPGKTKAATGS